MERTDRKTDIVPNLTLYSLDISLQQIKGHNGSKGRELYQHVEGQARASEGKDTACRNWTCLTDLYLLSFTKPLQPSEKKKKMSGKLARSGVAAARTLAVHEGETFNLQSKYLSSKMDGG